MKVTGKERELGCGIQGQKDSLSSWFTLLSVQTFYADIMQMFSGPCSRKSGGCVLSLGMKFTQIKLFEYEEEREGN